MSENRFMPAKVKTEIYNEVTGKWIPYEFDNLCKGHIFRTYKSGSDTEFNKDEDGHWVFKAKRDARTENGFFYTVDCEPVSHFEHD